MILRCHGLANAKVPAVSCHAIVGSKIPSLANTVANEQIGHGHAEMLSCFGAEPSISWPLDLAGVVFAFGMWGAGERYFVVRSVSNYPTSGTYRHHHDPRFCDTFVCIHLQRYQPPPFPLAISIRIRKHGNSLSPLQAPRDPLQLTPSNSRHCGPTETQSARPS